MRKGERSQEKHFHANACKLNSHLTVLTGAAEAFLQARAEGSDPVTAVLSRSIRHWTFSPFAEASPLSRRWNMSRTWRSAASVSPLANKK